MITERAGLLTVVAETMIGTGDPGPWDVAGFLDRVSRTERADAGPAVEAILDRADSLATETYGSGFGALDHDQRFAVLEELAGVEPQYAWLARLINAHYYSTPAAWAQVGWSATAADGWPEPLPTVSFGQDGWITPDRLLPRYDAIVVGGGAGGGAAALVLAEAGRSVLIIESGSAPPVAELSHDHLRNPRVNFGLDRLTDLRGGGWPRTWRAATRRSGSSRAIRAGAATRTPSVAAPGCTARRPGGSRRTTSGWPAGTGSRRAAR